MSGRKDQNKYRQQHVTSSTSSNVTRHIVPAKNIDKYSTVNNGMITNYRMGTTVQNAVDSRIDNSVYNRTPLSTNGSYIPPDRVRDRLSQQLEQYKLMDNPSKRDIRDMYIASQNYDMDLRMYNGLDFDRR